MKKISRNLSRFFFYFFVFLMPFQVDVLLFGPETFVSGFFNSYLVHFLYLADLFYLLGALFLFFALIFQDKKDPLFPKRFVDVNLKLFIFLFLFSYIFSLLFAIDRLNSAFYFLRALQFSFFAVLVLGKFLDFRKILKFFVATMLLQAILGILQFALQSSVGLNFLGEPLLAVSLKNLAKISLFGADFLRAYGTFVHPNVFGAYLVFAIFGLLYLFRSEGLRSFSVRNVIFILLFSVLIVGVLSSFSRSAILALLIGMILFFRKGAFWPILGASVLMILIFAFAPLNTLSERFVHFGASLKMFLENPFGVGAGNFTLALPDYLNIKLYPWQFQPVHNIFLLTLSELGVFGGLALFGLLIAKFKQFLKFRGVLKLLGLSLFSSVIVFGLFDHYLLTLYQGQFFFWLLMSVKNP